MIALFLLYFFIGTADAQQAVILVRHAELAGTAMAAPKELPLSKIGEERAMQLAQVLKDAGVDAIYVTDFMRTRQTAAAIAHDLNKEPTILPKGDPRELVDRLRKEHGGQTVLLVGHTDTIPGLLKALGHPKDIKIEADDYSNLFVVLPKSDGAPTLLRLRY
jgi:broad specificity phosphatase PhoE